MELRKIKGIGDRMAQRIIQEFGSEEEFLAAAQEYEVDRLSRIEGVSQRRAVEIINELLGNPSQDFLKTGRSQQIYDDIITRILEHASTEYAKNRIMLLSPTKDKEKIQKTLKLVMEAKSRVKTLPEMELKKLLKKINPLEEPKPRLNPEQAILVENKKEYQNLLDRGLNRYSPILSIEEIEGIREYEIVIYAYSDGILELEDGSNVAMIPVDSDDLELAPEIILNYYQHIKETLENTLKFRKIMGWHSEIGDALTILEKLSSQKVDESSFNQSVEDARKNADLIMKKAIKQVDLSGEEVLDLLNQSLPSKIQEILDQVLEEAREEIKINSGVHFNPFLEKYPLEIDEEEVERVRKQEMGKRHLKLYENKVAAARELAQIKNKIDKEVREVLEFDYIFSLGIFAHEYGLKPPQIDDGFSVKGALHLDLVKLHGQRVDYEVKKPDNVVLLTGANSGGKTTLLETLSQISILTQMGLPVPAQEAQIELIDELYFFSKKRSLDAGAFESFLRNFIPIATENTKKLILLDELEAITELEAAVKIISSFMDLIRDSGSHAVIVTHLAREILKYTQVRVDGIEATGLDDEYNLIVDRTPRMNYLARSTPELILRRVCEKSDGKLKEIYRQMLEKF